MNRVLLIACIVSIMSVACSAGRSDSSQSQAEQSEPIDQQSLVIYSGRSETLVGPIIEQFSEATNIQVEVKYGKTGAIAATLLEEGTNSPSDIFFAQDPGGLGAVANANMLQKLDPSMLIKVPNWAKSPQDVWVGVSGRARTIVYNTEAISPKDLPTSMAGFTDPIWKNRIGWAPTNGSFQAMVTAMRVQWGEENTREWLEGIKLNDPTVYPKNTPQVAAAAVGEIDVGFVNHYYAHRFLAEHGESFNARNHHLEAGGPGSIVFAAGAGILKTSKNKQNAEKFLNFMLSPVAQQYFTSSTHEYPVVSTVTTNPLLIPIDSIIKPEIDMALLEDLAGTQTLLRDLGLLN